MKLFPLGCPPESASLSYAQLRERYRKWDVWLTIAFLALAPFCAYALHSGFLWYTRYLAQGLGPSVYTVLPESNFWYAPASVLGVILACFLIFFAYEALLRRRAREYRYYSNMNVGFNASRMYLVLGSLLGVAFAVLAYFAAHSSFQLTESEIVVHRLFSGREERYAYARVMALRQISDPAGEKSTFVIDFYDAKPWTTKVEIVFPDEVEKAYLSERCGKPIEHESAP